MVDLWCGKHKAFVCMIQRVYFSVTQKLTAAEMKAMEIQECMHLDGNSCFHADISIFLKTYRQGCEKAFMKQKQNTE